MHAEADCFCGLLFDKFNLSLQLNFLIFLQSRAFLKQAVLWAEPFLPSARFRCCLLQALGLPKDSCRPFNNEVNVFLPRTANTTCLTGAVFNVFGKVLRTAD